MMDGVDPLCKNPTHRGQNEIGCYEQDTSSDMTRCYNCYYSSNDDDDDDDDVAGSITAQ